MIFRVRAFDYMVLRFAVKIVGIMGKVRKVAVG